MQQIPPENGPAGVEPFMADFYLQVESIKAALELISNNIRTLQESYNQALVLFKESKSPEELESIIDATNLAAYEVRMKLKDMDAETKRIAAVQRGTAEHRIRATMQMTLSRRFLDLMNQYQEVQTNYRDKYRQKIERQIKIVNPEATEEQINEAIETGHTQVFTSALLEQNRPQALEALHYVEDRHRDIVRLEQSIQELHQLFIDISLLIESQGEILDQVEYNVSQSVAHTKEAVAQLAKADKYAGKSRKRLFFIVCCILVLVAVGVAVGVSVPLAITK